MLCSVRCVGLTAGLSSASLPDGTGMVGGWNVRARGNGFEKPDFGEASGAGALAQVAGCRGACGVGIGRIGVAGSAAATGDGRVVMDCHNVLEAAGEWVGVSLCLLLRLRRLLGA